MKHCRAITVVAAALPLLLEACAYNRPQAVSDQMSRTEAVLQQANSDGTEKQALADLQLARDKYARAKTAYARETEQGDEKAMRLARQAEVDAAYASAKAQARRQQQAASEVQRSVQALREQTGLDAASSTPPTTSN